MSGQDFGTPTPAKMSSSDCKLAQEAGASAVANTNNNDNESDERTLIPRNDQSCKICKNLKEDVWNISFVDFLRSAENGCSFCQILREAIQAFENVEKQLDTRYEFSPQYNRVLNTDTHVGIYLYVTQDESPLRECFRIEKHPPDNPASEESFSWFQAQMDTCLSHHSLCAISPSPPTLPTRVLDLGTGTYPDDRSIKVLETHESCGKYIALSHRWGDPKHMPTRLTARTFDEYRNRISYDSLPQTFQDAISFTRKMKIQYLWIDSLCIIQADENDSSEDAKRSDEDWKRESSKMCSVYQNAHLTLAAAFSTGCDTGMFFSHKIASIPIPDHQDQGRPANVYAYQELNHYEPSFPLLKRGWVTQERLLSPRIILFGKGELLWRCKEMKSCECSNVPEKLFRIRAENLSIMARLPEKDRYKHLTLAKAWYALISQYSATSLTYQSDRLVAIDGLKQCISPFRGGKYLAGLWSDTLATDLLWYVRAKPPQDKLSPTETSRKMELSSKKWLFPTWSWASVASKVEWPERLLDYDGISSFVTRVKESDKMPEYHLKLRGVLLYTTLTDESPIRWCYKYYPDYVQPRTNNKVTFLRVARRGKEICSLVLKCVDKDNNIYERMGLVCTNSNQFYVRSDGGFYEGPPHWWEPHEGWIPEETVITLV